MKTEIRKRIAASIMLLACAGHAFAGTTVGSVSVGAQAPNPVQPGSAASYPVTVTRTGTGNLDVYLTITNLPSGVTASFVPSVVHFAGSSSAGPAALTLSTSSSLASGRYGFVVTGRDGGSQNAATNSGVLVVGSGGSKPPATGASLSLQTLPGGSVQITCVGTPAYSYQVQATTNLANPSWTVIGSGTADSSGLCSFIDADAGNFPYRFYRAVTTN